MTIGSKICGNRQGMRHAAHAPGSGTLYAAHIRLCVHTWIVGCAFSKISTSCRFSIPNILLPPLPAQPEHREFSNAFGGP